MKRLLAILVVLGGFFLFQHYDSRYAPDNEFIRYMTMLAWSDTHTTYVDPVFTALFPGWKQAHKVPNMDSARINGHYYMDKAPGLTAVACIFHPIFKLFLNPFRKGWIELQILTFLLVTLPSLIFLYFVFLKGKNDLPGLLLFALGTPFLLYATVFFGILPAGLIAYSGYILVVKWKRWFWGGLLVGLSVLFEYPIVAVVAAVSLVVLIKYGSIKQKALFFAGYLPTIILQFLYNSLMFGDPMTFAYAHKFDPRFAKIMGTGVFGFNWPSLYHLYGLLFSPQRGLFFLSPILILFFYAVFRAGKQGVRKIFLDDATLIFVVTSLIISGFSDWKAGASPGPRHLIGLLPFMAEPFSDGLSRLKQLVSGRLAISLFGLFSMFQITLINSTLFYLSIRVINPVYHEVVPMMLSSCVYYTTFSADTLVSIVTAMLLWLTAGILLVAVLYQASFLRKIAVLLTSVAFVAVMAVSLNTLGDTSPQQARTTLTQIKQAWCQLKPKGRLWLQLNTDLPAPD